MLKDFFSPTTLDYSTIDKKVVIAIQFKEDPDQPERLVNFNFLKEHYEKTFPNWKIIYGYVDDKYGKFNYGKSANQNLYNAFVEHGADVCYLSDADCLISTDALIEAVLYASQTGEYCVPYNRVLEITQQQSNELFKSGSCVINEKDLIGVCTKIVNGKYDLIPSGGTNVIPRNIYEDGIRFEERYLGYAFDDVSIHKDYLDKYKKLFHFTEGVMYSLWNERPFNPKNFEYNRAVLNHFHRTDAPFYQEDSTRFPK
jgi:predicted glycosyltransferase involved in capsule biosynthesis